MTVHAQYKENKFRDLASIRQQLMLQLGEFDELKQMHREINPEPVSYTHLTLPTTPYV